MIWLALYPLYSVLALAILEGHYLIIMCLKPAHDAGTLSPLMTVFGNIVFVTGYAWDIWCNLTVVSPWMLDWPREFTVSAKLRRLVIGSDWRARWSIRLAEQCLNPFSPGGPHIPIPSEPASAGFFTPKGSA